MSEPAAKITLTAKTYIRPMGLGGSSPQLVQGTDDRNYVIKLMGNPQTTRILPNEFVTGKLAEILGAPCPQVTTIEVDQGIVDSIIRTTGHQQFRAGIQHAQLYLASDTVQVFPSTQERMAKTINIDKWPNAIVLDSLTQNGDLGEANVVVAVESSTGVARFWHVDHGHTLGTTSGWTNLGLGGVSVRLLFNSLVSGSEPFKDAFERLQGLSRVSLEPIVRECPLEAWGVPADEREKLLSYLMTAKSKVQEAIIGSKDKFPNWK